MPSVSGKIKYRAYTLYLTVSMAELFPHNQLPPFLTPTRGMGINIDPDVEASRTVLGLIMENEEDFLNHLHELTLPGSNVLGTMVWKGDILVDPEGDVEFEGVLRRPTAKDFRDMAHMHKRLDEIAHEEALEHARHCKSCAAEMGLDPSEVEDDGNTDHLLGVWVSTGIGEA